MIKAVLDVMHRRLKGGGGLEGAEPPQYLERRGSAPKFLLLSTYATKRIKLILLVLMKLPKVLTCLQTTMMEKWLNNCLVLHVHKCITNEHDLVEIATELNDEQRKYLGTF